MRAYKKTLLFKTPLLLFPFNTLFFIRRTLYDSIKRHSSSVTGKVLDIGCGSKPYQELFPCDEYVGVDVEVSGHLHDESNIDYFYDGSLLPFDNKTFDSVVCFEVLEHVCDVELTLKEAARVLEVNGAMLVSVPFIWGEHEVPFDFRRFTANGLVALFRNAGFEIEVSEKSGIGIGSLYQLMIENYLAALRIKIIGKIIYALFLSWFNIVFYCLSKVVKRDSAALYSNVVILARKSDNSE